MDTLRLLDDRLLADVISGARHTGWLHGAVLTYATYGLALFVYIAAHYPFLAPATH